MSKHSLKGHADRTLSVTLLPCGPVGQEEINHLASFLSGSGIHVVIAKEQPIPRAGFNAARQQYRADDFLKAARSVPGARVLVVTNCDLYADNLNFVFGLAESLGRCAVISLFRLRIGANEETFGQRAAKEAIHELGHTLALPHCANPRCVMHFSNSLGDTDRKGTDWCKQCEKKLQRDRGDDSLFQERGG
jgi:archaemetzincin